MKSIYLIGICGTAMGTLAVLLKQRGFHVRGSDMSSYPPMSDFLLDNGITPLEGYSADHISEDIDLVVVGNAVSRGNPEIEAVLELGLRYSSLPDVVRNQFLLGKKPIVVAGTHGKTTTAFMTAWALMQAGLDPGFLIGGISRNFDSGGCIGKGEAFVVEGDEYDSAFFDKTSKFLKYIPKVVVVNSVEFDHADIYKNLNELRLAFTRLLQLVPQNGHVFLCADDDEAIRLRTSAFGSVETFGLDSQADWRAINLRHENSSTKFDVIYKGQFIVGARLPLLGDFNVRNALAAFGVAATMNVSPAVTSVALNKFLGVRRRLEVRGVVRGITVYDDFAHHPTAVRETLQALRSTPVEGRLWAVFEPRSATACLKIFQEEFAKSLGLADEVVVSSVSRTKLSETERLSVPKLVSSLQAKGTPARYLPKVAQIVETISKESCSGDRVVVMSNGDFGNIHIRLLTALKSKK